MALRQHISSPMTKRSRRYVLMVDREERGGSVCSSSITMASVPPPALGKDNVQSQGLVSGDLHQLQHGKAPPSGEC
ncbi:hypothetical protein F2Q70_00025229 [Brassica cretica]|uniref:Uncharacterized protein n=1 Tax=Brassica cretica TaxID=69181 RepID=A0A8S9LGK6_BRACR|nr:hypothetical protein F2Q70_00025229 [Brassica cretica]